MTSKPPRGMAAAGHSDSADQDLEDLSDEIDVDSSQDVTVEASEEATLEVSEEDDIHAGTETPPPVASQLLTPPPTRRAPTLLGLPIPSLPLPGVTAAAPEDDLGDDEVTVMARPSVTDDDEEATKVEPAETILQAALHKDDDDVTTALSAQASIERERALRKSSPPSLDLPLPGSYDHSDEFEDPEDDGISLASDTPASISLDDDADAIATSSYAADQDEPSSELEAVLAPRRPVTPFASPALGRSEGFGAARLPTPSPGFGVSLPGPGQAPAPSSSPFSARLATLGSPYAARQTSSSLPALQIPAPSGVAATSAGTSSGFFKSMQMPVAAVIAFVVAAFVFGVVTGAKFLGGRGTPSIATAIPSAAPAPAPVVIQPVAPLAGEKPAAEKPPTAAAAPPAPVPPVAAAAAAPSPAVAAAPPAGEAAPAEKPAPKRAAPRPAVRKAPTVTALGDDPVAKPAPRPAKAAKKPAKAWVNPFAE